MSVVVVQIKDSGVITASERGVSSPSPGFALVGDDGVQTGTRAAAEARLDPLRITSNFWDRLDTQPPLSPELGTYTRADLACAHLKHLWQAHGAGDTAILAVPGFYDTQQLGLLLGIAEAAGVPVSGIVDTGVAAALHAPEGPLLHIDIGLHRSVETTLTRDGDRVRRTGVETNQTASLLNLWEAWMRLIAECFVGETRFDPLHQAATEQQVFDALPGWLDDFAESEALEMKLTAGEREHRAELTRESLIRASEKPYDVLAGLVRAHKHAGHRLTVLLSYWAARLPGLKERLAELNGIAIIALDQGAAALGALSRSDEIINTDGVSFVTALTAADSTLEPDIETPEVSVAVDDAPTHVLCDNTAYAITAEPLMLGLEAVDNRRSIAMKGETSGVSRSHCSIYQLNGRVLLADHSRYGSFVNEERVKTEASLSTGDTVRIGTPGIYLKLIRLVE